MSAEDPSAGPPQLTIEQAVHQLHRDIVDVTARQTASEQSLTQSLEALRVQMNSLLSSLSPVQPPIQPSSVQMTAPIPAGSGKPKPLRPKVASPSDYDGNRAAGRAFLNSCLLYIRMCSDHFRSESEQMLWVMSYMKSGRAVQWTDQIFREEELTGISPFADWEDFIAQFRERFLPVDSEAAAVNTLEGVLYFQRDRSVADYLDEFKELISESKYTDSKVIVIKFRRGLRSSIQDAIATMSSGRPSDSNVSAWYQAASRIDLARQANDAFRSTQSRVTVPSARPTGAAQRPWASTSCSARPV